jgi:hypothetical protein
VGIPVPLALDRVAWRWLLRKQHPGWCVTWAGARLGWSILRSAVPVQSSSLTMLIFSMLKPGPHGSQSLSWGQVSGNKSESTHLLALIVITEQ